MCTFKKAEGWGETLDVHLAFWGIFYSAVGGTQTADILRGGDIVELGVGPCLFHWMY